MSVVQGTLVIAPAGPHSRPVPASLARKALGAIEALRSRNRDAARCQRCGQNHAPQLVCIGPSARPEVSLTQRAIDTLATRQVPEIPSQDSMLLAEAQQQIETQIAEIKRLTVLLEQTETNFNRMRDQLDALNGRMAVMKGECACCGRKDIAINSLVAIDSGQDLCPQCLDELRGA